VLLTCACVAAVRPLSHLRPLLFTPGHGFARWIENVQSGSEIETALYRLMQLPGGDVLFRRAPRETLPALTELQRSQKAAALYSLRALEEEQLLDFTAAERDWKAWADQADDRIGAHLDFANFYERRLQPQPELAALESVGNAAPDSRERWTAVELQRSWRAFERALNVVDEYALPRSESARLFAAWIKRYPQESSLYARQFALLLAGKDFAAASSAIVQYRSAFPTDDVFPVRAEADLAAQRGQAKDGLAVYDSRFQPLWPTALIKSYFALVLESHNQRVVSDELRAKLAANPDDLRDAARLFYLYQQQGQLDSAKAVLTRYREQKESRGARWTVEELDTLEKLFEAIQDFPEAARYAYGLAADRSSASSERMGVVALTRILLTAPEQPLRAGAGNLALYRNIATMDRGPGYLNGILSLFLNTQGPENEYASEEQRAVPYFHRARAAELLAQIDQRFPNEPTRPQLHLGLMEAYATYGENQSVIREGTAILAQFPQFSNRVRVALELADAYERTRQVDKEFAVYQDLLKELSAKADGIPLGCTGVAYSKPITGEAPPSVASQADAGGPDSADSAAPPQPTGVRSVQYNEVLNRYLARLVALQRLPDALTLLRGELDRNPQDPGLYEKLSDFLQQNALNAHQEEVFQRAIQQFQDTGWYAKLARFYLRQRRNADYTALMHKVTDIFSGTELEELLQQAPAPDGSLALQVDTYANQHFPHDLRFVERLIAEYSCGRNQSGVEKLLWEHWSESPDLRNRLFELLSQTNRLDTELAVLRQQSPEIDKADWTGLASRNPAAERFWLEACLWQSHFEQGVEAANALAAAYPADTTLGEQASSLYRSLAYFHPEDTDKAVAIQKRLLDARPGNLDTLARIGDIYADHERFVEAAPYWVRMAEVHPGVPDGYLQSATVFWDYFDFASAQAQLDKARTRLNQSTLFGYQEGAIAESWGDLPAAVRAYTASAVAGNPSSESRDRLLALARRPALRDQVEEGTAALLKQSSPSDAGIQLRSGILEAEHRKDDLTREINQAIAQTGSFSVLDAITTAARNHALPEVEESALRRQIALTADPVRNLQLRYQLVDFLGQRNALPAAQEIDALYREHGKILGVVRSTVDYDWNRERKSQAVTVLLDSAQHSYPDLKSRFQLEAARKLTDLGDYTRSRALLTTLLNDKPLDAGYETAMADDLARVNDQSGLAAFYRAQLELVRKASPNRDEKQQRIAQLRRGMIAAATQLGTFNDAVDQYIELINAYPDDAALAQEAALYSVAHNARDRLFGFYQKTINDSPRDPRWSIVLARLATAAEDDALAIDAYGKALRLRPERQDLYIAQAALDERLHHLDDAIALYRKLYMLTYRDPRWMEKVAELCARQGHNADAVKALGTGWIEGRPAKAANSFAVAERLERWGLLDDAQRFAEQGVDQAGADLLVSEQSGAATYARILARKRQSAAALTRLVSVRQKAPGLTLAAVAQQVVKQGPGAVTDDEWRKQREKQRRTQATAGFAQALKSMANAAAEFYTPEEISQFAALLKQTSNGSSTEELSAVYLPAVKAANLAELATDLEWAVVFQNAHTGTIELTEWLQFQRQRIQLDSAAAQLEKTAPTLDHNRRNQMWQEAATAYRDTGDTVGELRVTEYLYSIEQMQGEPLNRYYRLLLAQRPDELIRLAATQDSAAYYLIRNGNFTQALSGIVARATGRPAVWTDAYTALAGIYLREYRPEINDAFSHALNADATIGDRIVHPVDRDQRLAGDVWFYYGSRYGEYLNGAKDPRSDDYLESELEHTPSISEPYLRLADYSAGMNRPDAALADYQHTLDLKRNQPAVLDSIATLQWIQGHHTEALAAWSEAVKRLAEEMDARRVPETFWGDFARVLANITAHNQFDSVHQPVDAMLRIYIARNGDYRTEPLLEAGYHANGNSIDWVLTITSAAANQQAVLYSIVPNRWSSQGQWIEKSQLSRVYGHILELAQKNAQGAASESNYALNSARQNYVQALLSEKKFGEARSVLVQVSQAQRNSAEWLPSVLTIATADGTLGQLLAAWQKQPAATPSDSDLRNAVSGLDAKTSRAVLRFVYERALDRREITAANFLGLAAIDLDEGNAAAAIELLKRLTLVSENIYADTDAAAQLLEDRHHPAEALQFLRPLVEASPWDAGIKVREAKAMLAVDPREGEAIKMLTVVAADPNAPYRERIAAAEALRGQNTPSSGSDELNILAQSGCPAPDVASKPLFVAARVRAAACATSPKVKERLLREALATTPDDLQVRLSYIFAAFAANFDSRALVAAQPYLDPANYYGASYGMLFDRVPSLQSLEPADAAKLLRLALAAYERRRDFVTASRMAARALQFVHDPASRRALEDKEKQIDLEMARSQQNDARAPNVRAELDQDRIVRSRLLPGMPVSISAKLATEDQP
jgi:hypothetical protein